MKRRATSCILLALMAGPAAAQDWTFDATLYGWLPSLDTSVDTAFGTINSEASGSDVLDDLEGVFMGTFEAQNGPWSVVGDLLYTELSSGQDTPFGLLFDDAVVDTKVVALSGYLLYRVHEMSGVSVDAGVGFRAFDVDIDVTLNPGLLAGQSSSEGESWVDPLIAARIMVPFDDKWFGVASVDYGGTGSDETTWQAIATVGYRFNDRWSIRFGYRYLNIQHDIGERPTVLSLSGPLIGAAYRF